MIDKEMMRSLRLLAFLSFSTAAAACAIVACSSDDAASTTAGTDASAGDSSTARDGATGSDGEAPADAGTDGAAEAGKDGSTRDANGPGKAGTECVFNHDCQLALRCSACDAGYCFCEPGARGTGKNGIDACDSGDQCASSLCVEDTCSDECQTKDDCTGKLPRCVSVPGYATFCAPPQQ